ncbi:MAG: YczE/YyaS/YitT family protein [Propionicimonas sp.]
MRFRLPVRFGRRLSQLMVGLVLYGWSMAMLLRSGLGLDPWDVFHQGITNHVPLSFGQVTIVVGAVVLLLWIPLRQRPGIGTVLNVFVIGFAADAGLGAMPAVTWLPGQVAMLLGGVVANGLAGALYVGARLGPGPRDGLWVAITARTTHSIRLVRTALEVTIVAIGWLLGGTVGIGTVVYALAIGPLVQLFMPWVEVRLDGEEPLPEPVEP